MASSERVEYLASLTLTEWKDEIHALAQVRFYQGSELTPLETIRRKFTFDRVRLSDCENPDELIRELLISAIECL